jgi:hypothetical protein
MTRTVGRHAQIIPTLISMFDQLTTLAWSQVGLLPLANTTRKRSRIIDTIVTLLRQSVIHPSTRENFAHLQCADEKHKCDADALAPGHLKTEYLV